MNIFSEIVKPEKGPPKRGRRAPTNYRTRAVRIRLFLMVSAVMLVLLAMRSVADPTFWGFMGFKEEAPPEQPARKIVIGDSDATRPDNASASIIAEIDSLVAPEPSDSDLLKADEAFTLTQREGWLDVTRKLSPKEDRPWLDRVLYQRDRSVALSESDTQRWQAALRRIDELWEKFHAVKAEGLNKHESLSDTDRQFWGEVFTQSADHWHDKVRPVLQLAMDGELLDASQATILDETRAIVRRCDLDQVTTNSPLRYGQEFSVWFGLLDILQRAELDLLAQRSAQDVTFDEMYQAPEDYRGRLIQVHGVARLGYVVDAPKNPLGVEKLYVLWLQPADKPTDPIAVYCLQLPQGFPDLEHVTLNRTELRESVAVDAFYLKNFNHKSGEGTTLTPLMFAKSVVWKPRAATPVKLPESTTIVIWIIAIAAVAVMLAWMAYRVSTKPKEAVAVTERTFLPSRKSLQDFDERERRQDLAEQLKNLAEQHED